ncbi:MAG: tRNA lysidine(34) synthetase TilS, partial [Verrucomicrobiota bacterium]|nr:tRNA lysidine(34) synthetase TilS [Verrucomicrobiota bacterium]
MKGKDEGWGSECLGALPSGRRYLIGVSGGRDSVVLLHWLLGRGYRRLIVCHFEHGLRGRVGNADARFVERLAQKRGLDFELGSARVTAIAKRTKRSVETAARDERLAFFQRVASRRRCRTLFLAHQADDQVETFLMNLLRGAGSRGLGAMRERSAYGRLEIVRPFLGVWRSEIDHYITEHGLNFREDASNQELHARRNRTRLRIVPWLEKEFGRNVRANLWRAASILAEEEGLLDELLPNESETALVLEVGRLRDLPVALQRRTILRWLRGHEISDVGFAVIERVRALLQPDASVAKTNLPRQRHARRRAGKIFLE